METTFHNGTITIAAKTPTEAYERLCALLETMGGDVEYTTDSFTTDDDLQNHRDTTELWPKGDA